MISVGQMKLNINQPTNRLTKTDMPLGQATAVVVAYNDDDATEIYNDLWPLCGFEKKNQLVSP